MNHLVIFVKAPVAGRVKTRLARDLGNHPAAQIYRLMTADIIRRLTNDRRWQSWLAVTPDRVGLTDFPPPVLRCAQNHLPRRRGRKKALTSSRAPFSSPACGGGGFERGEKPEGGSRPSRIRQGPGDLGERMNRVFKTMPPGRVVIIGSDCPSMRLDHIAAAFTALGSHDCVVGPADDGGYWMIGLKRVPRIPKLFNAVRWSSPHALADTLASLPKHWRVAELATLRDIDTNADLRAHRARLTAPSTAA